MMKRAMRTGGVLVLAASALFGCEGAEGVEGEQQRTSTLEVPLITQSSAGKWYQLGGTFVLDGPEATSVTVEPTLSFSSPVLTLTPRVGSYDLSLCDGTLCPEFPEWGLYEFRCVSTSTGEPVGINMCETMPASHTYELDLIDEAILISPNPEAIEIVQDETTTATFRFSIPGTGTIVFARGTLDIEIDVGDGYPDGYACSTDIECASKVCLDGACYPAACDDGVLNGDEVEPDCGGSCSSCTGSCNVTSDCAFGEICNSGVCEPSVPGLCGSLGCPSGYYCDPFVQSGSCLEAYCATDAECPTGSLCVSGHCAATP